MKKISLILSLAVLSLPVFTQQTVQVGSGSNNTKGLPYSNEYEYNWCTVIYPQDQINLTGDISEIAYELFNNPTAGPWSESDTSQKIYMAHTSDLWFSDASYPNTASMTLVYDGPVSYHDHRFGGAERTEITLDTPFPYNGSDNLVIHIENRSGTKVTDEDNFLYVYSDDLADYPCKFNVQDGSFPSTAGTRTKELPIVYLTFDPGLDAGVSRIDSDMRATGVNEVRVGFSNHLTDEITSVDIEWEVNGNPQTAYSWSGSLLSGKETSLFTIGSYDFSPGENTIRAWTSSPNGGTDEDHTNDTLQAAVLVVDPVFVDRDAGGAKDGSSWTDAYDSLHTALEAVPANSIIWVAEGTYFPTNTTDRAKTFEVPDSVWLYGGFDGTESLLSERNTNANPAVLSGDIGTADLLSDNSLHVVTAGNYTRLDGFTVTGGNADSTCALCNYGGGILADTVENVRIIKCNFRDNYASVQGGALCAYYGTGTLYIDSCSFINNHAQYGGAIDCHDNPSEITRSVFAGNSATSYGGAIFNWGAGSDPVISHCSFYDNDCDEGSAIHNRALGIVASIRNSIFYGNPDPDIDLSSGAEPGDTKVSYCLIDQGEYTGDNNITGNPLFADTVNYKLQIMGGSPCIDAGDPASPLDPDGTVTDMGAFHFDLQTDAGVILHYSPVEECNAGIHYIIIAIKNFGKNTLTQAGIVCEIDGQPFTSINWNGSLSYADTSGQINLGSHDFGFGMHTIRVWTEDPNAADDELAENDTLEYVIKACEYLNGTYTIGASGDFSGVAEAVDSLSNICGISGPVTFDIEPDTYNDQIMISGIYGLSETNTVTFQSASGDSIDVVLTTDSTDYLLYLDGVDNIRFRNVTFSSDAADKLVVLDSGACNNIFEGNVFSSGKSSASLVYSGTFNDSNNVFQGNLFQNGNYGLNLYGSPSDKETSTRILNNVFGVQNHASVYLEWSDHALISGNEIRTGLYGIYLRASYSHTTEANRITIQGSNGRDGIRISSSSSDASGASLVSNNFVTGDLLFGAGINIQSSSHQKLYHNSVKVTGDDALELYYADTVTSKNNILISDTEIIDHNPDVNDGLISDYNSFFTTSEVFSSYDNAGSLAEWQAISLQDAHSLFLSPLFAGESDLHTTSYLIDNAGTPLSEVTEDIDGEERSITNPDIGADEFDSPCPGLLSGSYSIGPSGDFTGFSDAVYALKNCGVDGDVVFDVESGTYSEQVRIDDLITGYTGQDSITFRSAGNPESVILSWDADATDNYTLKLDGADRIIFRDISIQGENSTYGRAVELSGGASHNRFEGCIISGPATEEDDDGLALVYLPGDNTNPDTSNAFIQNRLVGGSYGICLKSNNTTDRGKNNVIEGNEFEGQSACAIRTDYQYNLHITGNSIEDTVQLDGNYYGIYLSYNTDSVLVSGNIINIARDYQSYGLYISAQHARIVNNAISLRCESQYAAGIYGLGQESECYFNSINAYGSGGFTAFDITYQTNQVDIKNNIFSNHASGYAFKCTYGTTMESDYNALYSDGTFLGEYSNSKATDLEEWILISGGDEHSVYPAPVHFVSDTDLHTSFVLFDGAALPISGITEDIDGDVRNISEPDIGADEFPVPAFSLGEDLTVCVDAQQVINAGLGFDSYLWSTGSDSSTAAVDSSGTGYGSKEVSVIVNKDGTDYLDTILVTFSSPIANPVPEYCFDHVAGSILITAGEGESYYWYIGQYTQSVTVYGCTDYTVNVTDANGCEGTGTITVLCNYCYANMNMPGDSSIYLNDSIALDGNIQCMEDGSTYNDYAYSWSTGDTSKKVILHGSELGTGTHTVTVDVLNKANDCETSDTIHVTVLDNTGFDDPAEGKVRIYPNPAGDEFYIEGENLKEIYLVNTLGQIIYSDRHAGNFNEVGLGQHPAGVYIVRVLTGDGVLIRKIMHR